MQETAYGIIPFYKDKDGLKVFLIHQYGSVGDTLWTFPKGRPNPGERPIDTAVREVKEETRLTFKPFDPSASFAVKYVFLRNGEQVEKVTTLYLGEVESTDFVIQENEIKEAGWFTVVEALEKLTFGDYKEILKKAVKELDN